MKKLMSVLMAAVCLLSCLGIFAAAVNADDSAAQTLKETIVYLEDGSRIVTTIAEEAIGARSTTKTIQKRAEFYDSYDNLAARLTVTGVFSINTGTSVTCTSSTYSTYTYVSGFSIVSPAATRANHTTYATATATGTVKRKVYGITVQTIPLSVTIRCNMDGSFS